MTTEKTIASLIRPLFGTSPSRITPTHGGQISTAFLVELDHRTIIVRTHSDPRVYAGTVHNLNILRSLGLPVPDVLTADLTQSVWPFSYLVLSHFPGRELRHELAGMSEDQMTTLARGIMEFQRRVAALPDGEGYGYVNIGERGTFGNWWDLLCREWSHIDLESRDLRTDRYRRIIQAAEAQQAYLQAVPATCFLDDITVKNVIVQNGALTGLIDFDCVCYGDPLWHLALTTVGVVADVGRSRLFYAEALVREADLSEEQLRALALYRAIMGAEFLDRCGPAETPAWRAQMEQCVEDWIRKAG
jgi:aminoglycoside phosphotransferase (APT) family kinase protein